MVRGGGDRRRGGWGGDGGGSGGGWGGGGAHQGGGDEYRDDGRDQDLCRAGRPGEPAHRAGGAPTVGADRGRYLAQDGDGETRPREPHQDSEDGEHGSVAGVGPRRRQ